MPQRTFVPWLPHPAHYEMLWGDIEKSLYKAENCDFLAALGGGSPIDAMKAIASLAAHGGDIAIMKCFGEILKNPFYCRHCKGIGHFLGLSGGIIFRNYRRAYR